MKKIYFLIAFLIAFTSFSQKDYSRYYNSWRLGLNLGGAWQTADYRSCWGMAGGITLEKGFHENATNIFSFAIRGRYFAANTYGMDYNRNYDVKGNDAYNGKYDPKVNFVDSMPFGKRYVYDNYKMKLGEGSIELQITFNRLRERTNVLFNLWGGIGFTAYETKSDLLDGAEKMYDFSLVDSTGSKTKALNSYNGLIDKKYESYAYGSKNGNVYTFSPSLGVGLGYQFSPGFSMLWEYKVTFPQGTNADLLDGKLSANGDFFGNNDYYHYTGLNLLFTLRGKKKTPSPKNETVYTNTVVPTQTVVVPTTSVTVPPTNTVVTNIPPTVSEPKPVISFITPPVNGHGLTAAPYKISAQILNVSSANQIQFKFNGDTYNNFIFNAQTHVLEYNSILNTGTNTVQIIATNAAGKDNKSTTVVFDQPKPAANLPIITYINPAQSGSVSPLQNYTVKAQVLNVTVQKQITVYHNGIATPFNYNSITKQVDFEVNLIVGTNTLSITASNTSGTDVKTTMVIYNPPPAVVEPPIVTYVNPSQAGAVVSSLTYTVKAKVLNITAQNQIAVYFNGMVTPFVFNAATKQISFVANLNPNSNVISINANNAGGSDTKTTSIVYRELKTAGISPVVNLINPVTTINASDDANYNFKLGVLNVNAKSDIEVLFNGVVQNNFNYNTITKEVFFNTNLVLGNNTLSVKGTNQYGSDIKTITVNYTPHVELKTPPIINFVTPASGSVNSQNINYKYIATISNIINASGITAKYNGTLITNFTYDGFNFGYSAILNTGANSLEISATNQDGNDVKTTIVIYKPKLLSKPPIVTILQPIATPTVGTVAYNFSFKVTNVTQNQIQVFFNNNAMTQFNFNGSIGTFVANLVKGKNKILVKATNPDGTDTKTEFLYLKESQAPIDTTINTGSTTNTTTTNNGNRTEIICHKSATAAPVTMTVPVNLLPFHLSHGDTKGACPKNTDSVIVNPVKPRTIQIKNTTTGEIQDSTQKQTPINTPRSPR